MTLEHKVKALRAIIAALADAARDLENAVTVPVRSRVLFSSPVTGSISTSANPFGLDWFDAVGYAACYDGGQYHTGCDLNRPNYADSGVNVYASADGEVCFSGVVAGWQGEVIVIAHTLEDGTHIWTRYAHVKRDEGILNRNIIKRGALIGVIADYNKDGPKGDHLHFDVAMTDLGANPADWPGRSMGRVLSFYTDPVKWLKARAQ